MNQPTVPLVNNQVYNLIKQLAQLVLPALGTLYFALADLWDLPNPTKVVGTITAVDVFLGVLLVVLAKSYQNSDAPYNGDMIVTNHEDGTTRASLELNGEPADLLGQDSVTFKVKPPVES